MIAERTTKLRNNRVVVDRTMHDRATLRQTWEKPRRPMAFRGPLIVRGVQELRFRSPQALAVLVASFCVSLLCFYVAAYAQMTSDTVKAATLETKAQEADEEGQRLQAELSDLTLPGKVEQRAKELKLVPATPLAMTMVSPSPARTPAPTNAATAKPMKDDAITPPERTP